MQLILMLDTQRPSFSFTCEQSCLFWGLFFFSPPTGTSGSLGGLTDMCLHQWILADVSSFISQHLTAKKQSERELKQPPPFSKDQGKWVNRVKWGEKAQTSLRMPIQNFLYWIRILRSFTANLCTDCPKWRTWAELNGRSKTEVHHLINSIPLPPHTGRGRELVKVWFDTLKWSAFNFSVQEVAE